MMDTGFYNSLSCYSVEARAEIAREVGYEGAYLTLWGEAWNQISHFVDSAKKNNLSIDGVWISLSMDDPAASLDKLKNIDEKTGWLANPKQKTVKAANISKTIPVEAGWLPDKKCAHAWLELMKKYGKQ